MVNNIAQEDQEGGPNGKRAKIFLYMCVYTRVDTCSHSLFFLFALRTKGGAQGLKTDER